jgi:tetratricopeptide (TPR) repeat protein
MQNNRHGLIAWMLALGVIAVLAMPHGSALAAESEPGFTPQMDMQDPEDEAFDTVEPDEPALGGKDGMGPQPSATPNKQDREDLLGGEESSEEPETRAEILQGLYDQLRRAKDSKSAESISEAIEQAWRNSGSDTVDLLMTHVDTFILGADLDLAMQVLDAVTELAPDDAEAWHQRALVFFMKGDNQRALSDLNHALEADPRHYKALRDLGVVLRQTGDKKGALEAYRKALEINPFLDQARPAEEELTHEVEGQDI